jgi:hypothetical protein
MRGRSAIELMTLMLTATVCLSLLFFGVAIAIYAFINPGADLSGVIGVMSDIVSMVLGALLGLLAGRSETITTALHSRPDGQQDGL